MRKVDRKKKKAKASFDSVWLQQCTLPGQLIGRVISRRKLATRTRCNLIVKKEEERKQSFGRYAKECDIEGRMEGRKALQGQCENLRGGENKGNLVGADETSEELAKWRRF